MAVVVVVAVALTLLESLELLGLLDGWPTDDPLWKKYGLMLWEFILLGRAEYCLCVDMRWVTCVTLFLVPILWWRGQNHAEQNSLIKNNQVPSVSRVKYHEVCTVQYVCRYILLSRGDRKKSRSICCAFSGSKFSQYALVLRFHSRESKGMFSPGEHAQVLTLLRKRTIWQL